MADKHVVKRAFRPMMVQPVVASSSSSFFPFFFFFFFSSFFFLSFPTYSSITKMIFAVFKFDKVQEKTEKTSTI